MCLTRSAWKKKKKKKKKGTVYGNNLRVIDARGSTRKREERRDRERGEEENEWKREKVEHARGVRRTRVL